ncbi:MULTISPECIES: hypothetical protein [Clostridia]|uniref:hypothetical protein n=1 Tax=Clostridia TaxID=186801 RepID=UPI000EA385AB|nr:MULTISPECIES: hypothetical protein [Clostridia]NBJ71619.1 hypothetical protein [Roseburia sp. 1XD42-34]RKI76852.1 hypothetical protein D7V87_12510 [Clostridium sp. 1xD42-85]
MVSGQKIKVDFIELQKIIDELRAAIDDFEGYTTDFRSNTRDRLKSFHSDFISKMDGLLDNMNNDVNQDLSKQMEEIHQAGVALLKGMKEVDEELGAAIGGDGS